MLNICVCVPVYVCVPMCVCMCGSVHYALLISITSSRNMRACGLLRLCVFDLFFIAGPFTKKGWNVYCCHGILWFW